MDKEKKESARRTTESFLEKSEIEKAFILGYMVKIAQKKETQSAAGAPELIAK